MAGQIYQQVEAPKKFGISFDADKEPTEFPYDTKADAQTYINSVNARNARVEASTSETGGPQAKGEIHSFAITKL